MTSGGCRAGPVVCPVRRNWSSAEQLKRSAAQARCHTLLTIKGPSAPTNTTMQLLIYDNTTFKAIGVQQNPVSASKTEAAGLFKKMLSSVFSIWQLCDRWGFPLIQAIYSKPLLKHDFLCVSLILQCLMCPGMQNLTDFISSCSFLGVFSLP